MMGLGWLSPQAQVLVPANAAASPTATPQKLVYGGNSNFAPYEYLDSRGQPRGFIVEALHEIARASGLEIEIRLGQWREIHAQFDAGKIDLVSLAHMDRRQEQYEYLSPVWPLYQAALFLPGRQVYPQQLDQLAKETVAVIEGSPIHLLLREQPEIQRPVFRFVPNLDTAIGLLTKNEVSAVASNALLLRYAAARAGFHHLVVIPVKSFSLNFATQKGRLEEMSRFDQACQQLHTSGRINQLAEEYLTIPVPPSSWRDYAWQFGALLSALAFVALGAVWWNLSLHREVRARTRELAESEAWTRAIVETAANGIIIIDDQGRIRSFNAAAAQIFGYQAEEVMGGKVALLIPSLGSGHCPDSLACLIKNGELTPGGLGREVEGRRRDSKPLPLEVALSKVQVGHLQTLTLIVRDLTERQQAETALKRAKESAEAANRAKSEFLANMSHEIRTPMSGVIGMATLALGTELSSEQRECLEMIKSSGDALLTVINDILDFSKIEAGRLSLDPIGFDLRETVNEALKTFAVRAREKRLFLTANIALDVPETIIGDPGRLRQILINLVGNAIKFTERGEVAVTVSRMENRGMSAEGSPPSTLDPQSSICLRFSVADTGIGIAPEKQHLIFDHFTQADGSVRRKYGGTGLGLAISKQLVRLMGGRIWVESEVGQGTTFYFMANFGWREAIKPEPSATPAIHSLPDGMALHILLAEDNVVNQKIVERLLERQGHTVVIAANGKEALAALERGRFDLVLMDVQMPEMDGLEAAAIIRERERGTDLHLPIIALTASAMAGDKEQCLAAGMDGYVSKPIQAQALFNAMASFITAPPQTGVGASAP